MKELKLFFKKVAQIIDFKKIAFNITGHGFQRSGFDIINHRKQNIRETYNKSVKQNNLY